MNEISEQTGILAPLLRKVMICSGLLLAFLLFDNTANAAPIETASKHKLAFGSSPAYQFLHTNQVFRLKNGPQHIKAHTVALSPPLSPEFQWENLGKKILHQIAGDDFRSYFGFEPKITVISNPLPMAALASKESLLFSSGLLEILSSRDEYAFLLTHEMAHQMLGHLESHSKLAAAAHWSLEEEVSADTLAMQLLNEAGYDRSKAVAILKKLEIFGEDSGLGLHHIYPTLRNRRELLVEMLQGQPIEPQLPARLALISVS